MSDKPTPKLQPTNHWLKRGHKTLGVVPVRALAGVAVEAMLAAIAARAEPEVSLLEKLTELIEITATTAACLHDRT